MELNVCPELWNLPSAEPESLIAITYAKFCKTQVELKKVGGFKLLTCELPFLKSRFSATPIFGFSNIIEHLRHNVTDTNSHLEESQRADLKIFSELVTNKLLPALKHSLWLDTSNFVETSRPNWASLITFPFSLYLPVHHRNKVSSTFNNDLTYKNLSEDVLITQVMNAGKEAINILSSKLGNQVYFFGDRPTSIDALLFGCLAFILYVPHPSHLLQNHLQACPNLVLFCQKTLEDKFPENLAKIAEAKRLKEEKLKEEAKKSIALGEYPNKKRDLIVALTVVGTSMLLYGIFSEKLLKLVVERN